MSRVEVLAPLRIETLFRPGADGTGWTMHLRVYPEDVSLGRPPTRPTEDELAVLRDALAGAGMGQEELDARAREEHAFRVAAASLGPRRAWWLWRTATTVVDEAGEGGERRTSRVVSSVGVEEPETAPGTPVGLPDELAVWLLRSDGSQDLVATLVLDHDGIVDDLRPEVVNTVPDALTAMRQRDAGDADPNSRGPWWLDHRRAQDVGLATQIEVTDEVAGSIAALVVVGVGESPAAELIAAHVGAGRLRLLGPGVATNSTEGERTRLPDEVGEWARLREGSAADQAHEPAGDVLRSFGVRDDQLPDLGLVPVRSPEQIWLNELVLRVLWPVLWGRTLHDIVGLPEAEPLLEQWAVERLALHGPLPALQVDDQPYGLLPTSCFDRWSVDPAGAGTPGWLEARLVQWARSWRSEAAAASLAASPVPGASPMVGASEEQVLELYGRHAPSAYWRVRPVLDLPHLQALHLGWGLALPTLTPYDRATSLAWRDTSYPQAPVAAAGTRRHLPGPDRDEDDPDQLRELLEAHPESLLYGEWYLGLLGHLLRESLIIARARVGRAWRDMQAGRPTDVRSPFPLDDDFTADLMQGTDEQAEELRGSDPDGQQVGERFLRLREEAVQLVDVYGSEGPGAVLPTVRTALDAASFRVDPWLTGVAWERLQGMAQQGASFCGGAYGWVDAPRPWRAGDPELLRPGPTAAGLVHAPSHAQAQVAAVLRDAVVADPGDTRWTVELTSDKVRRAVDLGERVRLGVHPFEALGLEVEAVAGDPDVVRLLRRTFPTTPEGGGAEPDDPTRRVCDGQAVLEAARAGTLPAGVPATLADDVRPLEEVVDTYADLLMVDGVHALMTRSPEAGGAAMEAAAGLATPPELWGLRTPREAEAVSVSCWAVLPAGAAGDEGGAGAGGLHPAVVADPAFAALVPDGSLDVPGHAAATRAAALLGGAEVAVGVPSSNHQDVAEAMQDNLRERWQDVWDLARAELDAVSALDPDDPATPDLVDSLDVRWRLGLHEATDPLADDEENLDEVPMVWTTADRVAEARRALAARLWPGTGGPVTEPDPDPDPGPPLDPEPPPPPTGLPALRDGIRTLVGRQELPVLPVVERGLLPAGEPEPEGRLEREWLETVAAVRPRLQALEAHQLTTDTPWPAVLVAPGADPWSATGPVQVLFGTGLSDGDEGARTRVAVTMLDAWTDSIPARHHVTQATFGFNAPKTRAPQAVLLAVPPDVTQDLEDEALLRVVLEVRELALARATRPTHRAGLPVATPAPIVQLEDPVHFLRGWR